MNLPLLILGLLPLPQQPGHAAAAVAGPESLPQSAADLTRRERAILQAFAKVPPAPPSPTNAWADHEDAARLGRVLFFDPGLSGNGQISCATCHDPDQGWCDGLPKSRGLETVARNAPSVVNAAHAPWQFWDGRADSLWAQALGPIENQAEMGGSRVPAVRHLSADEELRELYETVFGPLPDFSDSARFPEGARPAPVRPQDPHAGPTEEDLQDPAIAAWAGMAENDRELVNQCFVRLGKAIEAFERKLNSGPAPFDHFAEGLADGDPEKLQALSPQALHGWRLFVGKANCISCHFGPTFSDGRFHNIGLPKLEGTEVETGRTEGIRKVRVDPMNGRGKFSDASGWEANQKLLYVVANEHVLGAYKTPSLRDVTRTAPYGHDGRFASLEEVLRFYSELPGEPSIGHREESLQALNLNDEEVQALLAFLESLTGPEVAPGP